MTANHIDTSRYIVPPDGPISLAERATYDDGGMDKDTCKEVFAKLSERLTDLQDLLYAERKHSVLVILQAMDAGGKDSTVRKVFGPVDPDGCHVFSFKRPTETELEQDFLWRVHPHCPPRGEFGVFNRSHYEDIIAVKVKNLLPPERWVHRYKHINTFEDMLVDEGTIVLKFFLHISKDYQKQRLERRLRKPEKIWKFEPSDLEDRKQWDEFQAAYEEIFTRCNSEQSPWYVIPAENRGFRNLLITKILVERLEALGMKYPEAKFDPASIVIDD